MQQWSSCWANLKFYQGGDDKFEEIHSSLHRRLIVVLVEEPIAGFEPV